jgi:hypothetical protein
LLLWRVEKGTARGCCSEGKQTDGRESKNRSTNRERNRIEYKRKEKDSLVW